MNKPKEPTIPLADALITLQRPQARSDAIAELRILKPRPGVTNGEMRIITSGNRVGKSMFLYELQRDIAIHHLQTILNKGLDATQMAEAEREAREWLHSIGSEL